MGTAVLLSSLSFRYVTTVTAVVVAAAVSADAAVRTFGLKISIFRNKRRYGLLLLTSWMQRKQNVQLNSSITRYLFVRPKYSYNET